MPRELKWGVASSKSQSFNVIYASCHVGFFQNSKKLENLLVGFSYTNLGHESYFGTSFILEANTDHWFELCRSLKVEPLLNLNKLNVDFVKLEIGIGCCLGVSAFVNVPTNFKFENQIVGIKAGFFLPYLQ